MLLTTRFELSDAEKQSIRTVNDCDLSDDAIKKMLSAKDKTEIFDLLKLP